MKRAYEIFLLSACPPLLVKPGKIGARRDGRSWTYGISLLSERAPLTLLGNG
jgi:hypothetical protein